MTDAASPWSVPNLLTMARIVAIPVIVWLILAGGAWAVWVAFGLYVAAALTDYLDGYLARAMKVVSPLGRMLDPIADKLLVGALLLVFAYTGLFGPSHLIAAILILLREILISGLREFLGDKQITLHVSKAAKYKTAFQLVALGAVMLVPVMPGIDLIAAALLWIAALLTVFTGFEYFRGAWPYLSGSSSAP